jgi:3-hydroxyacyl-CoA dehydrogenase
VAVVGAGTIGSGWRRLFERAGLEVRVWDEDPARRTAGTLAEAVEGAGWVQESVAEELPAKRALFAELDRVAPPRAILASSTSALPMSEIAAGCTLPGRCVVAHPTNPPDVVPLVEVVPGARTTAETTEAAVGFLRSLGQVPIVCRAEVHGFVLNRLQTALLREALYLHRLGVASAADIDRAVTEGLALRWAFLGPFAVEHTNAASLEDDLTKFGAVIRGLFDALGDGYDGPTEADVARLVAELEEISGGRSHTELVAYRDRMVERLRELKRGCRPHSGRTSAASPEAQLPARGWETPH